MIESIYIINITVELPSDVTVIPQIYIVNVTIVGREVTDGFTFFYNNSTTDTDLSSSGTCTNNSDAFTCDIDENNIKTQGLPEFISNITPNALRHGFLNVTWKAKNISNGVFGQNNNNGDHRIRCRAQRGKGEGSSAVRYSDYITVRGNNNYYIIQLTSLNPTPVNPLTRWSLGCH